MIYINTYNGYSAKAVEAIAAMEKVLKTSKISGIGNSTCSAYLVGAKDNLSNQGKRIQDFYKSIPGDIAKQVGAAFGGIFNNLKGVFGGLFDGILGGIQIPGLPSINIPFFGR